MDIKAFLFSEGPDYPVSERETQGENLLSIPKEKRLKFKRC